MVNSWQKILATGIYWFGWRESRGSQKLPLRRKHFHLYIFFFVVVFSFLILSKAVTRKQRVTLHLTCWTDVTVPQAVCESSVHWPQHRNHKINIYFFKTSLTRPTETYLAKKTVFHGSLKGQCKHEVHVSENK